MRKNRLLKQSFALILSFVMSFSPYTLSNLVSFAETEGVSISAETEITDEESSDSEDLTEDIAPAEETDDGESGFEEIITSEEHGESIEDESSTGVDDGTGIDDGAGAAAAEEEIPDNFDEEETEGAASPDVEAETENNEIAGETDHTYTSEEESEKPSDSESDSIFDDEEETEGSTSSDVEAETENNEITGETDHAYTSETEPEESSGSESNSIIEDDAETDTVPITDPLEETEDFDVEEEQKSELNLVEEKTAEETAVPGENEKKEPELNTATEDPEDTLEEKKELKTVRKILQEQVEGITISVFYNGEGLSDDIVLEVRKVDEDSQEQEEICRGILQEETAGDSGITVYEVNLLDVDGEKVKSLPGGEDFIVFFENTEDASVLESEEHSEEYHIYHVPDKSSGTLKEIDPLTEDNAELEDLFSILSSYESADISDDRLLIPMEGRVLNDLDDSGTEDVTREKNSAEQPDERESRSSGSGICSTAVRTDRLGFFVFLWENEQTVLTDNILLSAGNLTVSGNCGHNAFWKMKGTDPNLNLSITGSGEVDRPTDGWERKEYIRTVEIGYGITGIGESAFSGCQALEQVILPETLETIGPYAFADCGKLESIVIPESVTFIGEHALGYLDEDMSETRIIIHGSSGSAAQIYAEENDLPFVSTDQKLRLSMLTWKELQRRIDLAPNGASIVLETDVTADEGDIFLKIDKSLTLDLNGHTLDRNLDGAEFPRNDGCALRIEQDGILVLTDSSTEGSGLITGGFGYHCGGGVDVRNGGSFIMLSGTISGNVTEQNGGGVNLKNGSFKMTGGKICGNSACYGGGIYADSNSSIQLDGGEISRNEAGAGGGICSLGSFTCSNAVIINNAANGIDYEDTYAVGGTYYITGSGGGLYLASGNAQISHMNIYGNFAADSGGCICLGTGHMEMEDVRIFNNMSDSGGGISQNSGSSKLTDCIIEENRASRSGRDERASGDGGGIYQYSGICELTDCIVEENSAGNEGGGIFLGGSLLMNNSSVQNNTAGGAGGGVRICGGILSVMGSVKIEDNYGELKTAKRRCNVQFTDFPRINPKNRIVIAGALQETKISITSMGTPNKENPEIPVTRGLAGNGDVSFFTSDQLYDIELNKDGEAVLKNNEPRRTFIYRLYWTCLNREADQQGLDYWLNQVDNGNIKGIGLAKEFIFSKEFISKNYCNEHFVRKLYEALMNRFPDNNGREYWTAALDNGTKREELLNKFASCAEYRELCKEAGIELGTKINIPKYGTQSYDFCPNCGKQSKLMEFVDRMYRDCLNRRSDKGGLVYWSKGLAERTITAKKLLVFFFLSAEVKSKNLPNREYVRRIYKAMLNREPDVNGSNYWTNRLDKGDSPATIINGFINSKEFQQVCENYGIIRK